MCLRSEEARALEARFQLEGLETSFVSPDSLRCPRCGDQIVPHHPPTVDVGIVSLRLFGGASHITTMARACYYLVRVPASHGPWCAGWRGFHWFNPMGIPVAPPTGVRYRYPNLEDAP